MDMPRWDEIAPDTAPAEPLTLAEAQEHLRVTSQADAAYITSLIVAARGQCESFTGATIVPKTIKLSMDCWPGGRGKWWDGTREGDMSLITGASYLPINLPCPPLVAVSEIGVFADDDSKVVVNASQYYVDKADSKQWARIVLRRGGVWPPALRTANAIEILYTCGYGASNPNPSLPAEFKHAIKLMVEYLYRNRGNHSDMTQAFGACGASTLLLNQRVANS